MSRPANPGTAFWDARKGPFVFFLVGWATAVSLNLWSTFALERAPPCVLYFLIFGVPAGVLLVIASPFFLKLWRSDNQLSGSLVYQLNPASGLVLVASQGAGRSSAKAAIRHHASKLRHLWVIVSESAASSWQETKEELVVEGVLKRQQVEAIEVLDSQLDDPEAIHRAIEDRVFGRLPDDIEEGDVLIDLTGGTKTATAGALLAGLPRGRRLQLVLPGQKDPDGRATSSGKVVEVAITYQLKKPWRA